MGISIYNAEGYYDPTAHYAVRNVERSQKKKLPLVYVCSPFAADPEGNTVKARRYGRFAVDSGTIPVIPHLMYPQFMSEKTERELAMHFNMVLLRKCQEVWVFGEPSEGMKAEIAKAKKHDMKIRYFTEECTEA